MCRTIIWLSSGTSNMGWAPLQIRCKDNIVFSMVFLPLATFHGRFPVALGPRHSPNSNQSGSASTMFHDYDHVWLSRPLSTLLPPLRPVLLESVSFSIG